MKPRDHEGVLAAVVDALKDCGAIAIGAYGSTAPSTYLAAAAELALEPVGGLWRDDEAFVVGWDGAVRRDDAGERWAEQQMAPLLHVADEQRRLA